MDEGARRAALAACTGGGVFWGSWQPTQDTASPGMAVIQLRISCNAWPRSSRGCMDRGVFAGTWKEAEPSSSTGTVPNTRLISQGPSSPTRLTWPPMPWYANW
ncbi:MAG: hypothetical protein BWX80_02013 [Candidatus Hydrogenedentes bacterium ADurb.Bin101]|nr:MAG: hypothetical protein BWX80_02013 [Candidatus Hydrogenedentes bacterium ADurb.Bin101]